MPDDSGASLETLVPGWVRSFYRPLQFVIDLLVLSSAFLVAYLLRYEFELDSSAWSSVAAQLPFVVLVQIAALILSGAHHRSWRYTNLGDLPVFLRAGFYSTVLITAVRLAPIETLAAIRIPLSIILMDAIFGFGGVVAARVARRAVDEFRQRNVKRAPTDQPRDRVLLVGAGRAGALAARELRDREDRGIEPVGFVDDDPLKQGSVICGLKVLGTCADIPRLAVSLGVNHAVLTIAALPAAEKRRIVATCGSAAVTVREIPGYFEILQGKVSLTRLRPVHPEQLLGREPVQLDAAELGKWLEGRTVLVSGAGGSIGSELVRQVAGFRPGKLILVERSEQALFAIDRELRAGWAEVPVEAVLADVCDEERIRRLLEQWTPSVVVHAAAHKHVGMMERHPCESVKNNIVGTAVLGRLAGEAGVGTFLLVSTDKAVNPTSVMGASKRVAELVTQDLNGRYPTIYCGVRFGNVLGSAGSVIPIFREQIKAGGPVTVTDREMTRYFMSIPEAAQLVLRAASLASGGEIFVLDMGEPVRILDLAEKMIELSGFKPYEDIPIVITGKTRGEKLFEELGQSNEDLSLTRHPKIFIGRLLPRDSTQLRLAIERLTELAELGDDDRIRAELNAFLPEASLDLGAARSLLVG